MSLNRRTALGAALALPAIRAASAQQTMEWVAGALGGGWYTMATGLANLVQEENPDLRIRVVPGGGVANPTRVQNGVSQIGFGLDFLSAAAGKGEEPYQARHDRLRSLGTGYSPTEHHFLRRTEGPEGIEAIVRLAGARIGAPQRSSSDELTFQRIMRFYGTGPDQLRAGGGRYVNGSYNDLVAAWNDGQIDYVYVALAKPAAAVNEIVQGRRQARLVAFPQPLMAHLSSTFGYGSGVIPAGTYPTLQSGDVPVTTMDSVILVSESMSNEVAGRIVATFIKNRGARLAAIHASMGAFDPAVSCRYPGVPLHPGARAAFAAAGCAA